MPKMIGHGLSRREREILEILYRHGSASAAQVLAEMPDAPTNSAVRSILRILVDKGYARRVDQGKQYLYSPKQSRQAAASVALKEVMQNFFDGSLSSAVKTFLSDDEITLSETELTEISSLIDRARSAGEERPES